MLETEGVKNINNVNDKLKAATSWHTIYEVEPALAFRLGRCLQIQAVFDRFFLDLDRNCYARAKPSITGASFGIAGNWRAFSRAKDTTCSCRAPADKLRQLASEFEKAHGTRSLILASDSSARAAGTFTIKPHGPISPSTCSSTRGLWPVGYSLRTIWKSAATDPTQHHDPQHLTPLSPGDGCTQERTYPECGVTAAFQLVR